VKLDEALLLRCCGSRRWVAAMLARAPFADIEDVFDAAEEIWWSLESADWLEAFAAHPRIGERGPDAWSQAEQVGMKGTTTATQAALAEGNRKYEARFGHVFLICATGKSGAEMLAELERRLRNKPAAELRIAAEEQAKITQLRLEKLVSE
jgi:2-oxo-4-hydroxy-4-carboxy-5-ureidoimidazoline decarboxylase